MPRISDQVVEFEEEGFANWKSLVMEACAESGIGIEGASKMVKAFFKALDSHIRNGGWTDIPLIGKIGYQEEMHYRKNKPALEQYKKFGVIAFDPNQHLSKAMLEFPDARKLRTEKTRELIYKLQNPHDD